MAKIPDVIAGELILASWGNAVRDTGVQVFPTLAAAKAEIPAPPDGMMAHLTDDASIIVGHGGVWCWRSHNFAPVAGNLAGVLVFNPSAVTVGSSVAHVAIAAGLVHVALTCALVAGVQTPTGNQTLANWQAGWLPSNAAQVWHSGVAYAGSGQYYGARCNVRNDGGCQVVWSTGLATTSIIYTAWHGLAAPPPAI